MEIRDLTIVGAGPAGLAAAISAKRLGLDYRHLEKGTLVNSIFNFPRHMVFLTTPELLEIGGLPLVTPYEKPTRFEALRYYRRVADTFDLQIEYGEEVLAIDRKEAMEGPDAVFAVETRSTRGVRRVWHSRTVILAIGYYDHPNRLDVLGEELPHVSHYYTESHAFYRRQVVIVGGGNSAAETALELYRAGAHVTLVHCRKELKSTIKYWVRPDIENRLRDGSIVGCFETRVLEIRPTSIVVERAGVKRELSADAVFLLTGYHPDWTLLGRAGVHLDPATQVPQFNAQTFETNVPGLFLAGGAVCGKDTSAIFIENGRFHGETIVKEIGRRLGKGT